MILHILLFYGELQNLVFVLFLEKEMVHEFAITDLGRWIH